MVQKKKVAESMKVCVVWCERNRLFEVSIFMSKVGFHYKISSKFHFSVNIQRTNYWEKFKRHIPIEKHIDINGRAVRMEFMFEQLMVENLNEYIFDCFTNWHAMNVLLSILESISWANTNTSFIRFNIRICLSKYSAIRFRWLSRWVFNQVNFSILIFYISKNIGSLFSLKWNNSSH